MVWAAATNGSKGVNAAASARLRGFAPRACVFAAIAAFVIGSLRLRDWLAERSASTPLTVAGAPSAAESALQAREQTSFFEQQLTRNPDDVDLLNEAVPISGGER